MDKSLRARLNRLFSTNVIVRRITKNRLRAIDTNKLQSSGNLSSKRYVSRFSGIQKGSPGYGTYNSNVNYHTNKIELYSDYEAMDMDPIISSALDIYADESTVKDAEGDTLTIATPDDRLRKVLYNLFYDILNIDYNFSGILNNNVYEINISVVNCLGKFDEGSIPELDEQIMNFVFLHK